MKEEEEENRGLGVLLTGCIVTMSTNTPIRLLLLLFCSGFHLFCFCLFALKGFKNLFSSFFLFFFFN